jgi:hypothetical protein
MTGIVSNKPSANSVESFRSLRKFFGRATIAGVPFDERLAHHEGRKGHDDRINGEDFEFEKNVSSFVLFVCFVVKILAFGCGSALGLCGEYSFTVNPEE